MMNTDCQKLLQPVRAKGLGFMVVEQEDAGMLDSYQVI
jgi:hypothetical protein